MLRHSPTSALLGTAALVALLSLGTRILEPDLDPRDRTASLAFSKVASVSTAERRESGDPQHAMRITAFARRYDIEPQLSRQIYEAARAERVSPALAFGLVLV